MGYVRTFVPRSAAQSPLFVGVDLGGTNVKIGVVDDLGRPLSWVSIPTDAVAGPDVAVRRMAIAVGEAIAQAGLVPSDIVACGLGSPGTMDIPTGMLLDPPNLPGWQNYPLRDRLSDAIKLPVTFANDANSAAFGEFWVGSGRELDSMIMFTLGTGVGGGIILGDLSVDGHHSTGSELGHVILDHHADARMCPCGQPGHLEAYSSATAVVKRTRELLDGGRASSIIARLRRGEELTTLLLGEEADAGDPLADEVLMEAAGYLGVGITTVMHTIDPEGVVLGGAMTFGGEQTPLGRRFLERVRAEIRRRAFPVLAEKTKVAYAYLGGDAGFIGAAGLARLAHHKTVQGSGLKVQG
jgi:glucokinase